MGCWCGRGKDASRSEVAARAGDGDDLPDVSKTARLFGLVTNDQIESNNDRTLRFGKRKGGQKNCHMGW